MKEKFNLRESYIVYHKKATEVSDGLMSEVVINEVEKSVRILLEAINKPIVVDGDDKLIEEAKKNDWQYISFR